MPSSPERRRRLPISKRTWGPFVDLFTHRTRPRPPTFISSRPVAGLRCNVEVHTTQVTNGTATRSPHTHIRADWVEGCGKRRRKGKRTRGVAGKVYRTGAGLGGQSLGMEVETRTESPKGNQRAVSLS